MAKRALSKRSIRPPWPGMILPESFTPAARFHRDHDAIQAALIFIRLFLLLVLGEVHNLGLGQGFVLGEAGTGVRSLPVEVVLVQAVKVGSVGHLQLAPFGLRGKVVAQMVVR